MSIDTIVVNGKKLPWLMIGKGFKIPSFNYVTETETVPGRDGQILKNRRVESYDFEIPLIARNDDYFRKGEKRSHDDILNEVVKFLNYNEPVSLKFESQKWYWKAIFEGPLEIDKRPFSHVEFTIKVKVLDPFKYSDETFYNTAISDQLAILNNGTASTKPIIKAKALKNSTSFMITKGDENYFQVGEAESTSKVGENLNPVVAKTDGASLSGWSYFTAGQIVSYSDSGAIANGTMETNGYIYTPSTYGTRSTAGWYGPAVKKSFPNEVVDFTAIADMKVFDAATGKKGAGKVFVHLLDSTGKAVCSFGLLDASASENKVRAWFGLYNEYGERKEIYDSLGGKDGKGSAFDDNYIHLQVTRRNNFWTMKTWAYHKDKNGKLYIGSRMTRTFKDVGNLYSSNIAQVGFQMSKHTAYDAQKVAMNSLKVVEHKQGSSIPYIIKAGDEVYIDMEQEIVLIDGHPSLDKKTLGSDYFQIESGMQEMFVFPQETFETTVEWKDRFL